MTPFDPSSRYANVPIDHFTLSDGRVVAYVRRRFVPPGWTLPLLTEIRVQQPGRLDLVAAATLGDPTQFWRIADANDALDPAELAGEAGARLRIPIPQP